MTRISKTHDPDADFEQVRSHFSEAELVTLSIAIAMINAWNRLAIGARAQHPADIRKLSLCTWSLFLRDWDARLTRRSLQTIPASALTIITAGAVRK